MTAGTTASDAYYRPELPPPSPAYRVRNRSKIIYRALDRFERQAYRTQHPAAANPADGVRLERRRGRLLLIRTVPGATPAVGYRLNRDLVADLCESIDAEYFNLPEPIGTRHRIGIAEEHWATFAARVIEVGEVEPIYVGVRVRDRDGQERRWFELTSDPRIRRALVEQPWVEIFIPVAASRSAAPYLRSFGCVVERWSRDQERGLSAPNRNQVTAYIGSEHQVPVTAVADGRPVRTFARIDPTHLFDPEEPIDAVYLWVDGSDPAWLERKLRAQSPEATPSESDAALAAARFSDNGELRYSFRSLELYAPWIRHIYLVTDAQTPHWLDTSHPRVTVVDHRDIFPSGAGLPTFNSHAIGANLHHLEGLSERYLYLNDDLFFGRPISPSLFFPSSGLINFHLSKITLPYGMAGEIPAHEGARRNAAELLQREFGRLPTRAFYHTPIAQRKSILAELEERYPDVFRHNSGSRFRSTDDYEVNAWLHHYYAFFTGRAVPGSIRYGYFDISRAEARDRMATLLQRRDVDTFCINDTVDTSDELRRSIPQWLSRYFPQPSSFEKREGRTGDR